MIPTIENALQILERTPFLLKTFLLGLDSSWTRNNEGENTWSPFDVIGHLIHGEKTDWIPRAKIILKHGTASPFTPFDRFAQFEESKHKNLEDLLKEFENLRRQSIEQLKTLTISEEQLQLRGLHPELGTVTLKQLISTWVVHDLGHIAQISRVMAKQCAPNVGPWKAYLRILQE